jgi:hypothetical protein
MTAAAYIVHENDPGTATTMEYGSSGTCAPESAEDLVVGGSPCSYQCHRYLLSQFKGAPPTFDRLPFDPKQRSYCS